MAPGFISIETILQKYKIIIKIQYSLYEESHRIPANDPFGGNKTKRIKFVLDLFDFVAILEIGVFDRVFAEADLRSHGCHGRSSCGIDTIFNHF